MHICIYIYRMIWVIHHVWCANRFSWPNRLASEYQIDVYFFAVAITIGVWFEIKKFRNEDGERKLRMEKLQLLHDPKGQLSLPTRPVAHRLWHIFINHSDILSNLLAWHNAWPSWGHGIHLFKLWTTKLILRLVNYFKFANENYENQRNKRFSYKCCLLIKNIY